MKSRSYLLALSGAAACFPLIYSLVRIAQHQLAPEPDPGAVIWSEHSDMLTRLMVAGFVGTTAVIGSLSLAGISINRLAQWIGATAIASSFAIIVQTIWWP